MSVQERLAAFLDRYSGKPVEWGVDDCSAVFVPWLAEFGVHVDLPRYDSREGAHALIARHGGLVETWDALLSGTGAGQRFGTPEVGDIGIVAMSSSTSVGVIFAAGGLALWRADKGGFKAFSPRSRYIEKVWAVA